MKKLLLFILCPFFSISSIAAQDYHTAMQEAFGFWKSGKITEAGALFERIGSIETQDSIQSWLPLYYGAHVLISASFAERQKDKRSSMLSKAESLINKAKTKSPNNSELLTLEALLYTSYVALDPANYGMQYSPKIQGLYGRAIQLNPKNPRALANSIDYQMNTARFFGKDLQEYCDKMKAVLPLFDSKLYDYPFAPSWGKDRAVEISKSCNN